MPSDPAPEQGVPSVAIEAFADEGKELASGEGRQDGMAGVEAPGGKEGGEEEGADGDLEGLSFDEIVELARKREEAGAVPWYMRADSAALCVFSKDNCVRQLMLRISQSRVFETTMMVAIFLNVITLAMALPTKPPDQWANALSEGSQIYFTAIFIVEFVIKVVALGFVMHPGSYLRDSWNQLDFVIILAGVLAILPLPQGPTSYLKVLRPLRAFKAVNNMEGLRVLVQSLLGALRLLGDVLLLAVFVFFIFGVIGVQLFAGQLHGRCYDEGLGSLVEEETRLCSMQQSGRRCPTGMACLEYEYGPQNDIIGFDNIGQACLTIFTAITLEGWTDTMYRLMDAVHDVACIYMLMAVVVGAFFFLNLALAVISTAFQDEMNGVRSAAIEEQIALEAKFKSTDELMQHMRGKEQGEDEDEDDDEESDQLPIWQPECAPDADSLQGAVIRFCYDIQASQLFSRIVITAIIANTAVLGWDRYPISDDEAAKLELANTVFTFLFLVEFIVKVSGLGPKGYVSEPFNVFDGIIVVSSLVELAIGGGGALRALRMLRMFKIINLSKEWDSLKSILDTMYGTLGAISNFLLLLFLIIVIFALLGMSLFGDQFTIDKFPETEGGVPRANYDDFWAAFISVYLVVIGENWNEYMYEGIAATSLGAVGYFLLLVVVGNFVMLNLFLAIFLDGFDSTFQSETQHLRTLTKWYTEKVIFLVANANRSPLGEVNPAIVAQALRYGTVIANREKVANSAQARMRRRSRTASMSLISPDVPDEGPAEGEVASANSGAGEGSGSGAARGKELALENAVDTEASTPPAVAAPSPPGLDALGRVNRERLKRARKQSITIQASAELLTANNELAPIQRVWDMLQGLVDAQISSAAGDGGAGGKKKKKKKAGLPDPASLTPGTIATPEGGAPALGEETAGRLDIPALDLTTKHGEEEDDGAALDEIDESSLSWGEWFLLQQFRAQDFVEDNYFEAFIIGLIAMSSVVLAIDHPGIKEGTDMYQQLYFINLVFIALFTVEMLIKIFAYGFLGYIGDGWNQLDFTVVVSSLLSLAIPEAQLLRALRVLRPLRIMSVNEGMRVIVDAITKSRVAIFNVLVVCMLFWLIFAIMGVSFFSGKYQVCSVDIGEGIDLKNCTLSGGVESTLSQNFDNTLNGLLTVFEISALEIWPDIMFAGIDATAQGHSPQRGKQPWMAAWFMLLVFCSSLFLVNLFVGVVVDNFKRTSEEADGTVYLTPSQRRWLSTQRAVFQEVPEYIMKPPENPLRAQVFSFVETKAFSNFIFVMIILNVAVMASAHYGMSSDFEQMLENLNILFTVVFLIEAILKITGLGWSYFKNNWNCFDFGLVGISLVTLMMKSGGNLSIFRIFRVFRVLRLIKSLKGLSSLLNTLMLSLPSIANVGSLLALLHFVYAILGMEFFYTVDGSMGHEQYINSHTRFTNFGWAMLTLFRALTG